MLQELTRPFTRAERRLLRRRALPPKVGTVFWMQDERRLLVRTLTIVAVMVLIGALFHQIFAASILAMLFGLVRFRDYRERRKLCRHHETFRQQMAEELESGNAYAVTCRPTRIFEREEFEDEGAFWIFDGGDGRYLILCGQGFYETPRFPSAHFEVVLGARHRMVIGIRSHGLRVPSINVTGNEIPWDEFPDEEVTMLEAPANSELPAILQALRASKPTA
jgi:hypothetical protein